MLLQIAIGDAYGAPFEFVNRSLLAENDLRGYRSHPRHGHPPGHYTDDTQMSLAIAELLVERAPFTRENLADKFVAVFHRDPREGYARGFHAFLLQTHTGAALLANIRADSKKSGAAMRAAPLGVLRDAADVKTMATLQARLTHDTKEGIDSAVAAALLSHYFLHDKGPRADVGKYLSEHVPGPWQTPWKGEVSGEGMDCVHAAITAITSGDGHETLSGILRACIAFGGDVDTVAAIAMGGASHARDITSDLPAVLVDGLENGAFGRDYIQALDAKLLALV